MARDVEPTAEGRFGSDQNPGGCACGEVRYRVLGKPLIVHCCHCSLCRAQSGSAYTVNALIEEKRVQLTSGATKDAFVETPTGMGQTISRCSNCGIAVWSKYHALPRIGDHVLFIRVSTLDNPDKFPPVVNIFTSDKQEQIQLSSNARSFRGFYRFEEVWSPESLKRWSELERLINC